MNGQVMRALFLDALYQVLDNKVFRSLAAVVLCLVLSTFVIGAREDGLVLLFGWKELYYEEIFSFFSMPYPGVEGAGKILVQNVQRILIDGLAGTFGILFAVAATAFFVPRMLEKGAADTLFSKPVSRLGLLLTRYLAGLLFVVILAIVLVGGMQVGFLLNSGYSDPGFLWSIVTLTYVFGLFHGVSILAGVVTRSTVAAILITLVFMLFNSCVHQGWQAKELFLDPNSAERVRQREEDAQADQADPRDESSRWRSLLFGTVDTLHYVLPKTTEAPAIARKLRADLEHRYAELWDPRTSFLLAGPPRGWTRVRGPEALEGDGMQWTLPEVGAALTLSRRESGSGGRLRASRELRQQLSSRPEVSAIEDDRGFVANAESSRVDWVETDERGERLHRVQFFTGGGRLYTLAVEGPRSWREDDEAYDAVEDFENGIGFDEGVLATNPFERFESHFDWDARLEYNIFFSIGSSLLFLFFMIALAWWRLARIDF